MQSLINKHIVVGVTGGIAAYKSADLVRRLCDAGAEVRVVMTASAARFVTPLTFQAVSGHRVHQHLLDADSEAGMGHIELARWADAVVVAPATANFLARLGHGLADDLLTTLCLATAAPIAVAPAMNQQMWANPATRDNMARLGQNGIHVLGPAAGSQACGDEGPGRMEEPEAIAAAVAGLFDTGTLAGLRVLVTAGPTREAVDPVRYLSNHSSGKMGFAVAAAAREAGAQVTLVSGPVALVTPPGVERLDVKSAQQMHDAVMERAARQDIVIGAAAVADYRLAAPGAHKMKKDCGGLQLALEPTPDILTAVTALQPRPFTVGFAAETQDLAERARDKRARKSLDMIAANWVGRPGSGFDSDDNALTVYWAEGQHELAHATKDKLARQLIKVIAERYHGKRTTQNT